MSVKGILKADQLTLAKFSLDKTKGMPKIDALGALTNSVSGHTHGYVDSTGVQWSKRTKKALDAFMQAVEQDMAETHLKSTLSNESPVAEGSATQSGLPDGGLGEWVDDGMSTPQI